MSNVGSSSLYGKDMLAYIEGYQFRSESAFASLKHIITQGEKFPLDYAVQSLGLFDKEVFYSLLRYSQIKLDLFNGEDS